MDKIIITLTLLTFCSISLAGPCTKDKEKMCYLFEDSDLKGIDTCLKTNATKLSSQCLRHIRKNIKARKKKRELELAERAKNPYEPGFSAESTKKSLSQSEREKRRRKKKKMEVVPSPGNLEVQKVPTDGGYDKDLEKRVRNLLKDLKEQK